MNARLLRLALLCNLLTSSAAYADFFAPAFGPDDIDWTQTRQIIDGKASEANQALVKKILGFRANEGNWDESKWELGLPSDGKEHTYQFLIVLKKPVAIGAIAANKADPDEYKGSGNGGEVFFLKADSKLPVDAGDANAWTKVEFAPAQPHVRFAPLPVNTKTQAILYTDHRAYGTSIVTYFQAYKTRIFSATLLGTGVAQGGTDATALTRGGSWQTQRKVDPITEKAPASYILTFDQNQTLGGLFLYSNGSPVKLSVYQGDAGANPLLSPASAWTAVQVITARDHLHDFTQWAYRYRWLSFSPVATRAIKIEITGIERGGSDAWIAGLGAFIDLRDAAPPQVVLKDTRPPFRVNATLPVGGEAMIVVTDANGKRVRNLAVQSPRNQGTIEEAWDLKDEAGKPVPPGKYTLSGIVGPPIELHYQLTPYPNVQQLWSDRVPWMMGHDSPHGWLSDHTQIWAVATRGDRVYFGAPMAEAGVCLIECDLDGKKLWGKHDFGPWTGVNMMAADENAVFVDRHGAVFRIDAATRQAKHIFDYGKNPQRRGWASAMAAHGNKVAFAFTGAPMLDNAIKESEIDFDNCLPKPKSGSDFARILRLHGRQPGRDVDPNAKAPQGTGRLDIESTLGSDGKQHAIITFKTPVPIGSIVLPSPLDGSEVSLSLLKPDGAYPPRMEKDALGDESLAEIDWLTLASPVKPGWNTIPAPANTMTRAIRLSFTRPKNAKGDWFGRVEGMKILRRRFENLASAATIRVNSGTIDKMGAWDAQRTDAIWHDRPGTYVMQWKTAEKISGLAIKEIDGAVTMIDVWQGPVTGEIPLDGAAHEKTSPAPGWRNVATYKQWRRSAQYDGNNNRFARYIDGYVDFDGEIETRAVRLRVIEQWLDNGEDGAECRKHDGRGEHGLHYSQSHTAKLDTRLCGIMGVAPLKYLRGEPPLDPLAYERVEIYDGTTGELLKELPARLGWHGLAFSKAGELFGTAKDHVHIVRIDQNTGSTTPVISDAQPHTFTVGPDDLIYVHSNADEGRGPILVYDMQGKRIRTIGKPGGWKPGPWDPQRLGPVHRMAVDSAKNLWLVETDHYPRRIVQFKTDGTFVKEILGNTLYGGGGGGTINRLDKTKAYYGRVEFEIDWKNHTSKIRGLLADRLENSDIVAADVKGQSAKYLVTAPLSLSPRQSAGCVYLYDEKTGTARLVAAMGEAAAFGGLRNSGVISLLKGDVLRDYTFVWSDHNGNGLAEAAEVIFDKKPAGGGGVGRFDADLGCVGNGVRYHAKEFLSDGTPIYERITIPGSPHLRLMDGRYFTLHHEPAKDEPSQNYVTTADGAILWGYPATGGVSGLSIPAWKAGLAANQFSIIGHEIAEANGLGEFVVVHSNTGQWTIWTADGLIAGQILLHKTDGRSRFLGPASAPPGTRLDPLTASQEHFHGFFTRSETDGKYYAILGFTNMSIVEVVGIDRFRRFTTSFEVTASDIEKMEAWKSTTADRTTAAKQSVISATRFKTAPKIDGKLGTDEWPGSPVTLGGETGASFQIGYDFDNLYLCYRVKGLGPMLNMGSEFQRYFKTGACLDLLLSTDPKADPLRQQPVAGDLRMVLTFADAESKAVIYQSVAPSAKPGEGWETFTKAGGRTKFDRVALLKNVEMSMNGVRDYIVEVSIPLHELDLKPKPGMVLKLDWGVLSTSDGRQVKQRQYWSNSAATGTADEAVEARLEPHLWGQVRFAE
ncbi:MAG: hypothetical protein SGJ03_13865 [Alphaproteobacteria bacterium]|nr:hypothetical protein [Alphaproteobacteria bacterium]